LKSSVIFVTRFAPHEVGHGGDHRAYQILCDLKEVVGEGNVTVVSLPVWDGAGPLVKPTLLQRAVRKLGRGLAPFAENPELAEVVFNTGLYSKPIFPENYAQIAAEIPKPAVCILEDIAFTDLVKINKYYGIPSIACFQNLESLDMTAQMYLDQRNVARAVTSLVTEFDLMAQYNERLFISRVEAGLIGGLGLSAHFYPYLPVGNIRRRLEHIRLQRSITEPESGLFLMLGSVSHSTTRESFEWLIDKVNSFGLPEGIRIIVGGNSTESLLPPGHTIRGIELKGWLNQNELDELLIKAAGVLVPQQLGFGALTRLPELLCAGIPIVVSRHATYAVDPGPNALIVDENWNDWCANIIELSRTRRRLSEDWFAMREDPSQTLKMVVASLLDS